MKNSERNVASVRMILCVCVCVCVCVRERERERTEKTIMIWIVRGDV